MTHSPFPRPASATTAQTSLFAMLSWVRHRQIFNLVISFLCFTSIPLGDTDTELPECPVAEKLTLPRGSAPSPAAFAHSHSTTSPAPETSSAASKIHFGERRKRQAGGCEDSATFCEEEPGYPAELVLTALNKHPVMSDGLFQQLFDSQCKVRGWEGTDI